MPNILPQGATHGAVDGIPERLLVGFGHHYLTYQPPVAAIRRSAAALGALQHRVPVAGDVFGVEVQTHWEVTPLAGQLERLGAGAEPRDPDRRMGLLVGLDVALHQALEHRRYSVGVPVLPAMLPGLVLGPDAQHDFQCLTGHLAMLAR